jgi:hypothetical protein
MAKAAGHGPRKKAVAIAGAMHYLRARSIATPYFGASIAGKRMPIDCIARIC